MAMEYLRIYLLGDRSVGKSALIVRYLTQKFVADCSKETGEIIFYLFLRPFYEKFPINANTYEICVRY